MTAPTSPPLFDGKSEYAFRTEPVGQWPAVAGTVVPAAPRDIAQHLGRVKAARAKLGTTVVGKTVGHDEVEAEVILAEAAFYARHLRTWDLPCEVSAATLMVLPVAVFDQLEGIVTGLRGFVFDAPASAA